MIERQKLNDAEYRRRKANRDKSDREACMCACTCEYGCM